MKFIYRKSGGRSRFPKSLIRKRLEEKTKIENGCFCWTGSKNSDGYGNICYNSKLWKVHRLSWLFHFGPIPKTKEVCHKCDNPACWNPDHLWLGTHGENLKDAIKKGRYKIRKGKDCPASKLTEKQIKEIRKQYRRGNGRMLAKKFGVTDGCIYMVASRKNWKYI